MNCAIPSLFCHPALDTVSSCSSLRTSLVGLIILLLARLKCASGVQSPYPPTIFPPQAEAERADSKKEKERVQCTKYKGKQRNKKRQKNKSKRIRNNGVVHTSSCLAQICLRWTSSTTPPLHTFVLFLLLHHESRIKCGMIFCFTLYPFPSSFSVVRSPFSPLLYPIVHCTLYFVLYCYLLLFVLYPLSPPS